MLLPTGGDDLCRSFTQQLKLFYNNTLQWNLIIFNRFNKMIGMKNCD